MREGGEKREHTLTGKWQVLEDVCSGSAYAPEEVVAWHRSPDLGKHPDVLSEATRTCKDNE